MEKILRKKIISSDKQRLHESVKIFGEPILEWRTIRFHMRIDELGEGEYGYAAWSKNKTLDEEPDLILTNGELRMDGSGGNHHYISSNGQCKYICYVNVTGTSATPPGNLQVYRGEELLLSEDVVEVLGI